MDRQTELRLEWGVSREQACVMCHLSSGCGGCCVRCKAEGKNGSCYGQICSQPTRDHQGHRWEAWMYLVGTFFPELKRFVPRKYWKALRRFKEADHA